MTENTSLLPDPRITLGEAVSRGSVPYNEPFSKNGYNPSVVNAEEDLWYVGGTYVFPTDAMQMEVVSSSANDTAEGTGVRTVIIRYLDASHTEQTEIVTLNGITAVPTVATNILRINNFMVLTAGTGNVADGNIDIRHLNDTPIYGRIPTGLTRARNATYTVPANKSLYIQQLTYSAIAPVAGQNVIFTMRTNQHPVTRCVDGPIMFAVSEIGVMDQSFTITYETPLKFESKTDIRVFARADKSNSNALCSVQYRGILVTDNA